MNLYPKDPNSVRVPPVSNIMPYRPVSLCLTLRFYLQLRYSAWLLYVFELYTGHDAVALDSADNINSAHLARLS